MRLAAFFRALICATIVVSALGACKKPNGAAAGDAGGSDAGPQPVASSSAAPPPLPAEPSPPDSAKDGGVKESAEALAKNPAMAGVWETKRRAQLNELLTTVSAGLETMDINGQARTTGVDKLKQWKLEEAFRDLVYHLITVGKLPDEFASSLRGHLASVRADPHMGVWRAAAKPGETWFDFSALAAWMNREDPTYLREHIAARSKGGTFVWMHMEEQPLHPWLAVEQGALAWLGMQLRLQGAVISDGEMARLQAIVASPLGANPPEDVELAELLKEYRSNEVRADGKFKGHVVELSGTAAEIKKNAMGHVYVVLHSSENTGATDLHCRLGAKNVATVSEYSKGDAITVKGRVSGMVLTSVMLNDCEVVPAPAVETPPGSPAVAPPRQTAPADTSASGGPPSFLEGFAPGAPSAASPEGSTPRRPSRR